MHAGNAGGFLVLVGLGVGVDQRQAVGQLVGLAERAGRGEVGKRIFAGLRIALAGVQVVSLGRVAHGGGLQFAVALDHADNPHFTRPVMGQGEAQRVVGRRVECLAVALA